MPLNGTLNGRHVNCGRPTPDVQPLLIKTAAMARTIPLLLHRIPLQTPPFSNELLNFALANTGYSPLIGHSYYPKFPSSDYLGGGRTEGVRFPSY
jgi:hypothetical protein